MRDKVSAIRLCREQEFWGKICAMVTAPNCFQLIGFLKSKKFWRMPMVQIKAGKAVVS
jgi:hypothetical protein